MVKSLSYIRETLKSGGRLMMHEIFEPTGWTVGFVFRLFPGWWVGVDGQDGLNRILGPSITLEQWNFLFQAAVFDGYDTCLRDENSLLTDQNSGWIFASRQKAESLAAQQSAVDGPTKQGPSIVDPQCEKQKDLASKTREKFLRGL
ncbi:putative polyketide synthase [Metarhizium brunneum]